MNKSKPLHVKKTTLGYGITDGKLWFAYAYTKEETATAMLSSFTTPERIRTNISYAAPLTAVHK